MTGICYVPLPTRTHPQPNLPFDYAMCSAKMVSMRRRIFHWSA